MGIFVKDSVRNERIETCRKCKHYTKAKTCGTPIVGKEVTHHKKKYKLCGCVMALKTKFKGQSCPLKKWTAELTPKEVESLREALKLVEGKDSVRKNDLERFYAVYNESFGTHRKLTASSCCGSKSTKQMIEEVKQSIE